MAFASEIEPDISIELYGVSQMEDENNDDFTGDKNETNYRGRREMPVICNVTSAGMNLAIDRGQILYYEIVNQESDESLVFYDDSLCSSYILHHIRMGYKLKICTTWSCYEGNF